MQMKTPYESYISASETQDSSVQIRMLYEAAIQYVNQAKLAIRENDHDTRYRLIDKAMSIMRGLRVCLDFRACEEVAVAMDRYYEALDKLMISVQCYPDEKICDCIVDNLTTIKRTWDEINQHLSAEGKNNNSESVNTDRSDLLI